MRRPPRTPHCARIWCNSLCSQGQVSFGGNEENSDAAFLQVMFLEHCEHRLGGPVSNYVKFAQVGDAVQALAAAHSGEA